MTTFVRITLLFLLLIHSIIILSAITPISSESVTNGKNHTNTFSLLNDLPETNFTEREHETGMNIFFILSVVAICVLLVHLLIKTRFHYLPESVAVVFLGAVIGLIVRIFQNYDIGDWRNEEAFEPTTFFLVLLPPIMFESGYNLHKGNFFQNIGSICIFAIFGTMMSAMTIGVGLYFLGKAAVIYSLGWKASFAFGSLISAVDPVATLAIFKALDVDPLLYMLVFGESIMNDAVAIVLASTVYEIDDNMNNQMMILQFLTKFFLMFFGSAIIGVLSALLSALLFKHVDLRRTPSLEIAMMFVFMYAPYGLAEGLKMSGIMAILCAGIVMSHYTHLNLSPITQITVQQTFRTLAFLSETCVFAYLGLAIFSFKHIFKPSLLIWTIVLVLLGRAANIFPLSFILNFFRAHRITKRMQFIMWFSGLRGAVAFALSLNIEFRGAYANEIRHVTVTLTLLTVLFTTLVLGGATMPVMKCLKTERQTIERNNAFISKTIEIGQTIDQQWYNSELTDSDSPHQLHVHIEHGGRNRRTSMSKRLATRHRSNHRNVFVKFDNIYLRPFFTRKVTMKELQEGKQQMSNFTSQWYIDICGNDLEHPEAFEVDELCEKNTKSSVIKNLNHNQNRLLTSSIGGVGGSSSSSMKNDFQKKKKNRVRFSDNEELWYPSSNRMGSNDNNNFNNNNEYEKRRNNDDDDDDDDDDKNDDDNETLLEDLEENTILNEKVNNTFPK
ncbi:hypothetical protein SNEBB_000594 [Seison nebaliae]|nr:hypothetical protein SNEBB_000594 [Seison nebaliae]